MEDSWLDPEEERDDWVEAINPDGDTLGYLMKNEAAKHDLVPQVIETPERYLNDPYVLYHAQLVNERGLTTNGKDLGEVQVVLLASKMIKQKESEKRERDRVFEERFFTANPEGFRAYKDEKERKEQAGGDVAGIEQRVPGTIEEFLATLETFSEGEDSDSDKGQEKAEGWLSSFLSDSDLDQMNDE